MAPFFLAHFVAAPAVFYLLFGPAVALTALANLALAEVTLPLPSLLFLSIARPPSLHPSSLLPSLPPLPSPPVSLPQLPASLIHIYPFTDQPSRHP